MRLPTRSNRHQVHRIRARGTKTTAVRLPAEDHSSASICRAAVTAGDAAGFSALFSTLDCGKPHRARSSLALGSGEKHTLSLDRRLQNMRERYLFHPGFDHEIQVGVQVIYDPVDGTALVAV